MLTPPETGHLNPSLGVAHALKRRGHDVVFYQLADRAARIEREGYKCRIYGQAEYPVGSIEREHAELGRRSGWNATRYTAKLGARRLKLVCREVLDLIREDKLDGIVADEVMAVGRTFGEILELPVVTLSNALPLKMSSEIPPPIVSWSHRTGVWGHLRNRFANWAIQTSSLYALRDVRRFQSLHGQPKLKTLNELASPLAHVTQIPQEFDFPRQDDRSQICDNYVFAGPFRDVGQREEIAFPFGWLDGRPLVYVSFGALQNRLGSRFQEIADLCGKLRVQAVLSLGGGIKPEQFSSLPSNVLVVQYAPQLELLRRADLCITHAGMNTTLECLALGVPMITIPVANDQPAVAARVVHHRVGKRITLRKLQSNHGMSTMKRAIEALLEDAGYRDRIAQFAQKIRSAPGGEIAADVVERSLAS